MLLTLEDQILNMNHVSRVCIKRLGTETYGVVAEYAPPMYTPRTDREGPRRSEFTVELHRGSNEECEDFISKLAAVWQAPKRNIVTVKEIRDSVGKF